MFSSGEIVDAGVVDQDVELAERLFGFGEESLDFGRFGDVGLHGDGLAAFFVDVGDDAVRAFLAGAVVDDDGRAFGGQLFGDRGADAFGCPGDDGDFASEFLSHDDTPFEQAPG